ESPKSGESTCVGPLPFNSSSVTPRHLARLATTPGAFGSLDGGSDVHPAGKSESLSEPAVAAARSAATSCFGFAAVVATEVTTEPGDVAFVLLLVARVDRPPQATRAQRPRATHTNPPAPR